jgi:endonuclease/exonuclease/phosphatase family metal-dependent hydrolase
MLKVVQYNIYFGNSDIMIDDRLNNICKCLNNISADVICLQEVLKDKYNILIENLKAKYPYICPDPKEWGKLNYDTVIMSKYPIEKSIKHVYEFTEMGRNIKLVLIKNNDGDRFYICTTHFESEFNIVLKKRYQYQRCADILHQIYQKTMVPIILCADTNICDESETNFNKAFACTKKWQDVWVEMGSLQNIKYTFDSSTNPILIKKYSKKNISCVARIDRILHLSDIKCTDLQLIGCDNIIMSDHYGLLSTFSKNS